MQTVLGSVVLVGLKTTQQRVEICCPDNVRFDCLYK